LHVDLVRPVPQPVVKTIPITKGQSKAAVGTAVGPTRTVDGESGCPET
jgi:hypothetical protein